MPRSRHAHAAPRRRVELEQRLAAREEAAGVINQSFRGWWARRRLRLMVEEVHYARAARIVQGELRRGVFARWAKARERRELHKAACLIQRAIRRKHGRSGIAMVLVGKQTLRRYFKWLDDFFARGARAEPSSAPSCVGAHGS